jgi:hypothetical protein
MGFEVALVVERLLIASFGVASLGKRPSPECRLAFVPTRAKPAFDTHRREVALSRVITIRRHF